MAQSASPKVDIGQIVQAVDTLLQVMQAITQHLPGLHQHAVRLQAVRDMLNPPPPEPEPKAETPPPSPAPAYKEKK